MTRPHCVNTVVFVSGRKKPVFVLLESASSIEG